MKKVVVFCLLVLAACKKKEETPKPAPGAPVKSTKQVSVKINNELFTCDMCANSYFSGGLHSVNVSEPGSSNRFVFNFDTVPVPGTYALEKFGANTLTYEKDGFYFRGRGTLIVTESETTSNGGLNLFKATFNCETDTASDGRHFSFTEGQLNLDFK